MPEMKEKLLVRNKQSGKVGVICPTIYLLSEEDPWSVFYDGASCPITLLAEGGEEAFEILGPENAIADPHKCGAGRGAECCIFLTCSAKGFECERFSDSRYSLIFRTSQMTAKREPTSLFPLCQITIESEVAPEPEKTQGGTQ